MLRIKGGINMSGGGGGGVSTCLGGLHAWGGGGGLHAWQGDYLSSTM